MQREVILFSLFRSAFFYQKSSLIKKNGVQTTLWKYSSWQIHVMWIYYNVLVYYKKCPLVDGLFKKSMFKHNLWECAECQLRVLLFCFCRQYPSVRYLHQAGLLNKPKCLWHRNNLFWTFCSRLIVLYMCHLFLFSVPLNWLEWIPVTWLGDWLLITEWEQLGAAQQSECDDALFWRLKSGGKWHPGWSFSFWFCPWVSSSI